VLPNIYALGADVNVPEHRGTVYSVANLLDGHRPRPRFLFIPLIAGILENTVNFPNNYVLSLMASQVFFVVSGILSVFLVFGFPEGFATGKKGT